LLNINVWQEIEKVIKPFGKFESLWFPQSS
jgi:hypothetical protein